MNQTRTYLILSVLGILLACGMVLKKKIPPDEWELLLTSGTFPKSLIPAPPSPVARNGALSGSSSETETEDVAPLPPVSENIKDWNDLLGQTIGIPRLESIPWERHEIEQALKEFRSGGCQLLQPGADVFPFPVELGEITSPVMSFRKSAVVVGLRMNPAAQRTLPKASKGEIEGYLGKHMLSLQATVFRNQQGETTFAGPIDAAFVSRSSPRTTIAPENMINDAIRNIRLLGCLPSSDEKTDLAARTLVLAFAYQRDLEGTGLRSVPVTDYELLFLHLVKEEAAIFSEPSIVAFATTDGRKNFLEIKPSETAPNIMAAIRFDEFKLMGLYPASPVVTGVTCQSRYSTLVEDVRNRLKGDSGLPPITFARLLDEIHQGAAFAGTTKR